MKPLSGKRAKLVVLGILLGATLLAAGGCALLESWLNPPPENQRPIDTEEAASILAMQDTAAEMCGSSSAEQAAAWLRQQGTVSDAQVADDGAVWVQYSCGLTGLVLPRDTLEGPGLNQAVLHEMRGDSRGHSPLTEPKVATATVSPTSRKAIILAFEPALSPGPGVALALRQAGFEPEAYVGSYFTLDRLRSLGEYGVVYISTHGRAGAFAPWTDTTWIVTGQRVPEDLLVGLWGVWWRTAAVGIGIASIEGSQGSFFAVNNRFLAREGVTMGNSLVLCGACQSFMYDGMANAFVDAGAAVYAGWSNTSFASVSLEITERLLESLAEPGCTFSQAWATRNLDVGDERRLYSIPELFPMTVLENRDGDGEWRVRFSNGIEAGDPDDRGAPDDYESDFVYLARSYSDDFVLVPPVLKLAGGALPTGEVDSPYDAYLTTEGGVVPLVWHRVEGSLPPGLSLGTATGRISGTPTGAGSFSFSVEVNDSSSPRQTATASFSIRVGPTGHVRLLGVTPPAGTVLIVGTIVSFHIDLAYELKGTSHGQTACAELGLPNGRCVGLGCVAAAEGTGTASIDCQVDVGYLRDWLRSDPTYAGFAYLGISVGIDDFALDWRSLPDCSYQIVEP